MKTFSNIASLVKTKRTGHHKSYSQAELALLLGLKSDYLIANIEEAGCGVPLKSMSKLSEILDIDPDDFKEAILKDHQESLNRYFSKMQIGKSTEIQTTY
ncbi:MAG: helix-turn-helix transcriptional regulator [Bacteriovorax sp.]|nr:helix-turn-helix transcriptional regulator [Bacteriovorax sp.]